MSFSDSLWIVIVSRYVLDLNDADVYRLPYLDSSDPGFGKY